MSHFRDIDPCPVVKTMKGKILDEHGEVIKLHNTDDLWAEFPAMEGQLEKNNIDVVDAERGLIQVEITKCDVAKMPLGRNQGFTLYVDWHDQEFRIFFPNSVHIVEIKGEKRIL